MTAIDWNRTLQTCIYPCLHWECKQEFTQQLTTLYSDCRYRMLVIQIDKECGNPRTVQHRVVSFKALRSNTVPIVSCNSACCFFCFAFWFCLMSLSINIVLSRFSMSFKTEKIFVFFWVQVSFAILNAFSWYDFEYYSCLQKHYSSYSIER